MICPTLASSSSRTAPRTSADQASLDRGCKESGAIGKGRAFDGLFERRLVAISRSREAGRLGEPHGGPHRRCWGTVQGAAKRTRRAAAATPKLGSLPVDRVRFEGEKSRRIQRSRGAAYSRAGGELTGRVRRAVHLMFVTGAGGRILGGKLLETPCLPTEPGYEQLLHPRPSRPQLPDP